MMLLVLTLLVALAGIAAAEFNQASRPRHYSVWNDDVERRLLRVHARSQDRW